MVDQESIYLIQLREFVRNNEPVYKIGKTTQNGLARVKSYPKGSVVLMQTTCCDCTACETKLIHLFKTKYTQRTEYGREYFEGNAASMKHDIFEVTNDTFSLEPPAPKPPKAKRALTTYTCQECNYVTNSKSHFTGHMTSQRHKNGQNAPKTLECPSCKKMYACRTGLWRHKKTCVETTVRPAISFESQATRTLLETVNALHKVILERRAN